MTQFDPRIDRDLAVQLGEEAVAIANSGRYCGPAGELDISAEVKACVQASVHYAAEHVHPAPATGPHATNYEVTHETTLSAHRRLLGQGRKVVSLNFAAATNPGGGFLTGARAQEEYLCRSSALFLAIKDSPMYAYHRREGHKRYSDAMIYSPDVPVFRDDEHRLLPTHYRASFITSAAPLTKHLHPEELVHIPDILRHRIRKILTVAQANGHDSLVLGAWGCGAFGNDGHIVSELFHRTLETEFKGAFKEVTFAIVDTSPEKKFIGPFAKRFQKPDEAVDIEPLWEIVAKEVVGKANDEWRLVRSTNPQVTHFLQMGMHGTNMKCLFIPKKGDEEGTGQVILDVRPEDLRILLGYAAAHPEALRVQPMNFPLNLEGNDDKAEQPTSWEKGGAVFAHAHLVTPAGPELYGRIGPWYAAALEGIWNFLGQAAEWNRHRSR
ncbi:MAG: TIGR02452 family protein [Opitutales bacterium]